MEGQGVGVMPMLAASDERGRSMGSSSCSRDENCVHPVPSGGVPTQSAIENGEQNAKFQEDVSSVCMAHGDGQVILGDKEPISMSLGPSTDDSTISDGIRDAPLHEESINYWEVPDYDFRQVPMLLGAAWAPYQRMGNFTRGCKWYYLISNAAAMI